MKLPTKEQYAASYHFISWLDDTHSQEVVARFMSNAKPNWVTLQNWSYVGCGSDILWKDSVEGWDFWNNIDDEWHEHLRSCDGTRSNELAPLKYQMPDGAAEMLTEVTGALADLFIGSETEDGCDVDPDIEPTVIAEVTDSCGVVLGRVKNATPHSHVFLLWLTLEQGMAALSEFLDFADEDWAENDDIDTVTLALDWASTPLGVKGWRKLNNQWQVYLVDNLTVGVDDKRRSLYFLTWLNGKYGSGYYEDFLDHAKHSWEKLINSDYLFRGIGSWVVSRHSWAQWHQVHEEWKKVSSDD